MGTRHLTCVYEDGEFKVAQYGQWDGYPECTGLEILGYLQKFEADGWDKFKSNLDKCTWITDEEQKERMGQFKHNDGWMRINEANKYSKAYPETSRNTGCEIIDMINSSPDGLKLKDDHTFAADALFCEWAYVIDLDDEVLYIYSGLEETNEPNKGHFADLEPEKHDHCEYYLNMIQQYSFDNLPDKETFVSECDPELEE